MTHDRFQEPGLHYMGATRGVRSGRDKLKNLPYFQLLWEDGTQGHNPILVYPLSHKRVALLECKSHHSIHWPETNLWLSAALSLRDQIFTMAWQGPAWWVHVCLSRFILLWVLQPCSHFLENPVFFWHWALHMSFIHLDTPSLSLP